MRAFVIAIIIALILAPVLAQGETLADLLSDPTCSAACYLGIEPGVTTQTTLENILNQRRIAFTVSTIGSAGVLKVYDFDPTQQSTYFDPKRPAAYVDVSGDIVDLITLFIDNVTVEQMLSWFGAPDAIRGDVGFFYFSEGLIFSNRRDHPDQIGLVFITRPGRDAIRMSYELDVLQTCDGPTELCAIPTATATPTGISTITQTETLTSTVIPTAIPTEIPTRTSTVTTTPRR